MYKSWHANSSNTTKKKFSIKKDKAAWVASPSYDLSKQKLMTKHQGIGYTIWFILWFGLF